MSFYIVILFKKLMNTKFSIAIAITGIMIAVALAPTLMNQGFAAKTTTTTCTKANGDVTQGSCPGNSGTNGNPNQSQTTTTKAGQGQGKGEIKDSSTTF